MATISFNTNRHRWPNDPSMGVMYQQPGVFAGVLGQNYGNYAGGMASTGKSYADAFGAYGMGLGSMANARANERSSMYGANAAAEAARQVALSNIGTAALGAYGGAANSSLAAWAANQQSYNQAAASMHNANQQGMSNFGVSRNNALGSLGGAYGDIGKAQVGADAISNINFSGSLPGFGGGGGGFSATGTGGQIASGSYGGSSGGGTGGFSLTGSRNSSSTSRLLGGNGEGALGGLATAQENLMSPDIPNRLDYGAQAGRDQLDSQHYSSRGMPSQMLGQTLSGLLTLGAPAYNASAAGMDQFYGANRFDERPYEQMRGDLNAGFGTVGQQIGGVQRGIESGYATANKQVNDLWENSMGQLPEFTSPERRIQRERDAELLRRRIQDEDIAAYESQIESLGSAWRNVAPGSYTYQEYMAMGDQERMALAARRREAGRIAAQEARLARRAGQQPWTERFDTQSSPFYARPPYIEEFVPRSPGSPWGQTVRRRDPLAGRR
jgi:hypothetical protein